MMQKHARPLRHVPSDPHREDLFKSISATIEQLKTQTMTHLDLKIIETSLKELQKTSKVFSPYHQVRKVTVFGSARVGPKDSSYQAARAFAQEMARLGFMMITGAGPGIMQAAHEGAGAEKSIGLNIQLPFEQMANPVIQGDAKLINYKYFFNRKLTMVKESDALVLFPGGFGTQDELFETLTLLQTGKTSPTPVICIDVPGQGYWKQWRKFHLDYLLRSELISQDDLCFIHFTSDIHEAVRHITRFFHNYHSIRFNRKWLLIRVWRLPSPEAMDELSDVFKDMIVSGKIEVFRGAQPFDPDVEGLDLKTLRLNFNMRSYGRLHQLIDALNAF